MGVPRQYLVTPKSSELIGGWPVDNPQLPMGAPATRGIKMVPAVQKVARVGLCPLLINRDWPMKWS